MASWRKTATRNSKDYFDTELLPASILRPVRLATEDGSVLCLQKPAHLHHPGARNREFDRRVSGQCQPGWIGDAAVPADESDTSHSALRYAGADPAGWPLVLRRIDPSRARIRR